MNPLEELHIKIDESNWDVKQEDQFNKAFQEVNGKLAEARNDDLLRKSDVERQTFAFTKTPEKGLSYKIAGTQKLEDGSEIPLEWPDIKEWTEDDFTHIRSRFDNCKNLFAFTEYGLLLFYSNHLKNNRDATKLLKALHDLAVSYYQKSLLNDDKEHYILYFRLVMAHAFHISDNRKSDGEIQKLYQGLILFSTKAHNTWDIKHKSTLRSIIDLTDFAIEYKKEFLRYVDLTKYLDQNFLAANELAKTYNWGAIYICDVSQRLADTIENKTYDWQTFKAEQFEAMVQPNIDSGNLAAVSFVENALTIYKKLGNKKKIAELSKRYDEVRRIFRLGEIRQELPKEEMQRIIEIINREVEEKNSHEIFETICMRPMYAPLERIKKMAEEVYAENSFSKLFPSSILDKYGNTVEVFITEEEKRKYEFWQTYSFNFQIGTQTLSLFFFEAVKAGKISFDLLIEFLSPSWIGNTYSVLFNGYPFEVTPLDAIKPGLKLFFDELEKWKIDPSYYANFICATDSLVTKTEYLLRLFCNEAGIPTFIDKVKNDHRVKNEKNIDELLRSLKHTDETPTGFFEDHRKFIEYVLAKKMGNNLRHRVAHGLMDAQEYTVTNLILILNIILILSTYKFNPIQNEPDTATVEIAK
jgi:hypothetical protein